MLEMLELLHRIYGQFLKIMVPVIREKGISPTEIIILRKVFMKGTYRVMNLARDTDLPPSTITGIVDRLVARNYILRMNDVEDRRSVLVQSTPELKKVMKEIAAACDVKLKEAFKNIPADFTEVLLKDLKELNQYLIEYRESSCDEGGTAEK